MLIPCIHCVLLYLVQHVRAESQQVVAENFRHFGFFRVFAQSDVVDEGPVAAAGVHDVKPPILVQQQGVLP